MGHHPHLPLSLKRARSFDRQLDHATTTCHSSSSSTTTSSPTSATFSQPGKTSTSSVSSMGSSPIIPDSPIIPLHSKRSVPGGLPDVAEDPHEPEDGVTSLKSPTFPYRSLQGRRSYDQSRPRSRANTCIRASEDGYESYEQYPSFEHSGVRRKKSMEQNIQPFMNNLRSKLGSLSRRSTRSRRPSYSDDEGYTNYSPSPSPRYPASRSVSRSQSTRNSIDGDPYEPQVVAGQIETILEDDTQDEDNMDLFPSYGSSLNAPAEEDADEIERKPTPLLPRFLDHRERPRCADTASHQPSSVSYFAQSPTSTSMTPADSPKIRSPTLSHQASVSSMRKSSSSGKRTSQVPPLPLAKREEDWTALLGHEDFTICPEPYIPEKITRQTRDQFLADWEQARTEYAKHQGRTETHYPKSSKTFNMTQRKWAWIDTQWREDSEIVLQELYANGGLSYMSPMEPAPVQTLADINDPRMIKPVDIVGPMKVEGKRSEDALPRRGRAPSRSEKIKNLFRNRRALSGPHHLSMLPS